MSAYARLDLLHDAMGRARDELDRLFLAGAPKAELDAAKSALADASAAVEKESIEGRVERSLEWNGRVY